MTPLRLKLSKIGNSVGIILPKKVLTLLNVGEGDSLSVVKGAQGSLHLIPTKTETARQIEVAQGVMKRYPHTLRELAK